MFFPHLGPSQDNFLYQLSKAHLPHRIVHEELALQWVVSSGPSRELAMTNSWFVSMCITHFSMIKIM
jgi:hypothetical protein